MISNPVALLAKLPILADCNNNPPPHCHDLHHQPFVCLPMSRGYELPETVHAQIVVLKLRGDSWTEIGDFLEVKSNIVRKTFKRWETTESFSSCSRAGHPKSFDEHDVRHLARHITATRDTRRQALGEIKNALNLTLCPKTLRNIITKHIGLGHRIKRKKPWLRPVQKEARLKFARDHIH